MRASGIPREEFFITTKLFPQSYPADQCAADIDATLARLDMDYVDLLLLHQPYAAYVQAWKALEDAVAAGKVRSISLSNFSPRKVREILEVAAVKPAVLQIEINPYWNQHGMKRELADLDLAYEAWYPLGHGDRRLLEEPVFARLADKYDKTPAQVILRWHVQEGNIVFPKTLSVAHMEENLAVFDFALTDDEMARFRALNDDSIPRIFDHHDLKTVDWLLSELVRGQQLAGAPLY